MCAESSERSRRGSDLVKQKLALENQVDRDKGRLAALAMQYKAAGEIRDPVRRYRTRRDIEGQTRETTAHRSQIVRRLSEIREAAKPDPISTRIEQLKCEAALADLESVRPHSRNNPPIESVHKYGKEFVDVKEENRQEIEGMFGVIDRSELLLCELPVTEKEGENWVSGTRAAQQGTTPASAGDQVKLAQMRRLDLGKTIYTLYEELKRLATYTRGRRKTEGHLRSQFPDFQLWNEIDDSESLSKTERERFFKTRLDSYGRPEFMNFIGRIVALEGETAYAYVKEYRDYAGLKRKRRAFKAAPKSLPKPVPKHRS